MKFRMMYRIIALVFIMILVTQPFGSTIASGVKVYYGDTSITVDEEPVNIEIEGQKVAYNGMFPVIIGGHTLVPIREVFEHPAIGAEIAWVGEENKAVVKKGETVIELIIDSDKAYVNGEQKLLEQAPTLMRREDLDYSKMMVPLRFITEALGYSVEWISETSTVAIVSSTPFEGLPVIGARDEGDDTENDNQVDNGNEEEPEDNVADSTHNQEDDDTKVIGGEETKEDISDDDSYIIAGDKIDKIELFEFEDYEDDVENEPTEINAVRYNKYQDLYSIRTEAPMSSIKYFIWEGKLVITISNASIGDIEQDVDVEINDYVTGVRSSQFSYEPLEARVVFDLLEGVQPTNVVIDEDRERIDVLFGNDGLKEMALGEVDGGDYLDIAGQYSDINTFRLEEPHRIIVDLENTINPFGKYDNPDYDGNVVSAFRIAQFNETTTRLVFETNGKSDYELQKLESGMTRIFIGDVEKPEDQFVPVEDLPEMLFVADKNIDTDTAWHIEYSYHEKVATVVLDTAISSDAGKRASIVDSSKVLEVTSDVNRIKIKTDHIYDFQVIVKEGLLTVEGARPSDIHQNIVLIDPGHGGYQPGAVVGGVYEKDLNLPITESLREKVKDDQDIKYYFTMTEDMYVSLEDRVEMANDLKADLFVSVHSNALNIKVSNYLKDINGAEIQISNMKEQSDLERKVAEVMLDYVEKSEEITIRAKGIKVRNDLYVLKNTFMPAVLIECGYMTNPKDLAFLTDPEKLVLFDEVVKQSVEAFFANDL